MSNENKLQLREGGYYRRRDGRVVGPARQKGSAGYPFVVGGLLYQNHGQSSLIFGPHKSDLIADVYVSDVPPNAGEQETRRDKFAMAVLQGMVGRDGDHSSAGGMARWAYELADAMLDARKGKAQS